VQIVDIKFVFKHLTGKTNRRYVANRFLSVTVKPKTFLNANSDLLAIALSCMK
jgi:hypothetical protein